MMSFRHTASTWREIDRLARDGRCACEIAAALGCEPGTVRFIAARHGVDLRPRAGLEDVDGGHDGPRGFGQRNWGPA